MKPEKFDVVILGGGNAGIGVTGPARRAGLSVAMIESHDLGGTCPNRGCTPKKVLVAAGHALHEIARAGVHHISVGKPKLDWTALIDREIAAGRLGPCDSRFAAEQFLTMVLAVPQRRALGFGQPLSASELERWAEAAVNLFLNGCRGYRPTG